MYTYNIICFHVYDDPLPIVLAGIPYVLEVALIPTTVSIHSNQGDELHLK